MKLLNLACGAERPQQEPWINIDNLHAVFPDPTVPERVNMDSEPNFLNADLKEGIPFGDNEVDGILMSHFLEHLTLPESRTFMTECYRALKPGGVVRVSVPDPQIFHSLTIADYNLWDDPPQNFEGLSYMEYALFFGEHRQLLTEESINCLFWVAGFRRYSKVKYKVSSIPPLGDIDNRPITSLFMEGIK